MISALYGSIYDAKNFSSGADLFDVIQINIGGENLTISKLRLAEVIAARAKEIIALIKQSIDHEKSAQTLFKHYVKSLVLSGGCANLLGLDQLCYDRFQQKTRIAYPATISNMPEEHKNPSFATAYGLVAFAFAQIPDVSNNSYLPSSRLLVNLKRIIFRNRLFNWFRKFFHAEI